MVKIILIFLLALGSVADGAQAPERSTRRWWQCGKERVVPVRVAPVEGVDKFLQKFSNCAVDATSYTVACGDSSASLSLAPTLTPVVKSVPVVSVAMAGGDSISSEDRVVALVPDADAVVAFSSESDVVAAVVPTLYVTCSTDGSLPVGFIRYQPGPISDDLHDVLVTTETLILAAQADTGWPVVGSEVNSMVSLYEHKKFAIGQFFQANAAGQCAAVAGFAYRSSDGARSAFFVPAMVKTIVRCYEDIIIQDFVKTN